MLPHSMPKEGIGSLRVNEGFQELEKLDASMLSPLVSFFIFEDKWSWSISLHGVVVACCLSLVGLQFIDTNGDLLAF